MEGHVPCSRMFGRGRTRVEKGGSGMPGLVWSGSCVAVYPYLDHHLQ